MKLTISIAQIRVAQAKPAENLKKASAFIAEASKRGSRVIAFPEMWTTGFDWAYNARSLGDHEQIIAAVADLAGQYRIWISGSMLAAAPSGRPANTHILFDDTGAEAARYRKAHLFSAIGEERHMEAGEALVTAPTPWGKTGLSVCYDIRFPEMFRAYALQGAVTVFSPMAFPYPKLHHWKTLLRARAIEDQFFMIGANQVGTEDLGQAGIHTYCGASAIIDPWGETVIEAAEAEETLLTATIDTARVDEIRNKMRVLQDRRPGLYSP